MDDLADAAKDLVTYLEFYSRAAAEATEPEAIAGAADAACTYFQGVGICELLLDAELDAFFHQMIRSGRMRRWLLSLAQGRSGFPTRIVKASNTRGLFAALVANDWGLGREIALLSATARDERVEYEDDFLCAHFIHRTLLEEDRNVLVSILGDYARALDGEEPPRYRLCASLLASPDAAPDLARAAFADLVEARRLEMDTIRATSIIATDELFVPFSSIYVEGLAWLRLLNRAGLAMDAEYVGCPSMARVAKYAPIPAEGFPD